MMDEDAGPQAQTSTDIEPSANEGGVDEHGIPLEVRHRNQNAFTAVWSFVHLLYEPITDPLQPSRPFTHICLVCCDKLQSSDLTSTAWRSCLLRCSKSSTNAKKHMLRAHKDHQFTTTVNELQIQATSTKITAYNDGITGKSDGEPKAKKQRTLFESMTVSAEDIKILATRWLLSSGLPYTVLLNNELLDLLRRLSNQPTIGFPARDAFYSYADGEFMQIARFIDFAGSGSNDNTPMQNLHCIRIRETIKSVDDMNPWTELVEGASNSDT
ncbi:hypothetical protein F444_10737 [Phytophthora nicotianae P1976]|uniref:Uncharacterized protein n=1 Tax=Phytophthora nicotianae P1976 TaxID=1317066 RepID=A0A081A334_PHYNI|nr:hypothetical protein F444_10737 [Phytophthora nicotianae P1976]